VYFRAESGTSEKERACNDEALASPSADSIKVKVLYEHARGFCSIVTGEKDVLCIECLAHNQQRD